MASRTFEQAFRAALAHVNAGRLAEAAAACVALRRSAPADPAVLQLHATIALRRNQPVEALEMIGQSLVLRPGHVPSLILAGRAAIAAGVPDKALTALREAVDRVPSEPEPAFLLCHTLLNLRHQGLDAALAAASERHAAAGAEWLQLAVALQRAGRSAQALAAFTSAAASDPSLARAEFGRGLVLRDTGRMQEAWIALQRAVTIDPKLANAWFALGLTCQDLDDPTGATAAFQAALREQPDFAEAAVNLGIVLQQQGHMEAAIDAWRTAVRTRGDTFGRIAQAVTSARTGFLCLDPAALRRLLGAGSTGAEPAAVNPRFA